MANNHYKYILFDLDGTLTDSGEGIMLSAQYALRKLGIEVEDHHTLRPFIGPPLEDSFKMFYGMPDEKAHEAVRLYRERYKIKGVYENEPYEGAAECLQRLKDSGHVIALGTSKPMDMTLIALRNFKLFQYFAHIGARDAEGLLHTKADVLSSVIKALAPDSLREVLMVGDRKFDVEGARQLGIDCAGITWGYGSREELTEAGATFIVDSFEELCEKA